MHIVFQAQSGIREVLPAPDGRSEHELGPDGFIPASEVADTIRRAGVLFDVGDRIEILPAD